MKANRIAEYITNTHIRTHKHNCLVKIQKRECTYKSVIILILTYTEETWNATTKMSQQTETLEMKVLKKII